MRVDYHQASPRQTQGTPVCQTQETRIRRLRSVRPVAVPELNPLRPRQDLGCGGALSAARCGRQRILTSSVTASSPPSASAASRRLPAPARRPASHSQYSRSAASTSIGWPLYLPKGTRSSRRVVVIESPSERNIVGGGCRRRRIRRASRRLLDVAHDLVVPRRRDLFRVTDAVPRME